ncbi:hypothetical protein [Micromonospora sp. NPDC048843]|uniref:hypothetical protein n=1 Tax=Micromonospora sp. NPDC048843 TaxID=3155389 RepID=UPI0033EEE88C
MQSGRLLRMRADAAGLLDDFSHQVRTRYPHPVAYRWSRAQVLLSNGADGSAYYAILETAEVLLCAGSRSRICPPPSPTPTPT